MALRPMIWLVAVYHSTGSPARSRSHLRNQDTKFMFSDQDVIVETEVENTIDNTPLNIGDRFSQTHNNCRLHEDVLKMTEDQLLRATDYIT